MLGNLGRLRSALLATLVAVGLALTLVSATQPTGASAAEQRERVRGFGARVMSFNILSSAMAAGGLDRAHRVANQVQETRRNVIAFQEVAGDQLRVLQDRLPRYRFYPKRTLGNYSAAIQIAWSTDDFRIKNKGEIYRPFLGKERAIPWVKLEHRGTERTFFVVAIHNAPGGHEAERDISTAREVDLVQQLERHKGRPVLVLGDMNERDEFCRTMARHTDQISMGGTKRRPCPVPHHGGPDWMLGSWNGTDFAKYRKVYNHISDHPMLLGKVWFNTDGR